jgi:hypothetical protein
MGAPWGWLVCIDASYCNDEINSPVTIQKFIDELLERIEMIKIGGLHIVDCDTTDPMKKGLSIFQLLQDSNVSAHFCPVDRNAAFLDCFSCKPYDPETVVEVFNKYFQPKMINYEVVVRSIPD